MKNENALGPAKNTTVSPRIFVFHTAPCCFVRDSVNENGSSRNFSASPTNGSPMDPGGAFGTATAVDVSVITAHRTTDADHRISPRGLRCRSLPRRYGT